MATLFTWCGFAGAWLLVIGPLYQGMHELLDQDLDRAELQAAVDGLGPPSMPSSWWWLLPPAMLVLRHRRNDEYRRQVRARLSDAQFKQLAGLREKAAGWFVVAAGATFIAAKETWELAEHSGWSHAMLAAVLLAMVLIAVATTTAGATQHHTSRAS